MKRLSGAALGLASGKGLENYPDMLQDHLTAGQVLLEMENALPSREMSEAAQPMEAAGHGHPGHTHVGVDPHWWNSVDQLIRSTRTVTAALSKRIRPTLCIMIREAHRIGLQAQRPPGKAQGLAFHPAGGHPVPAKPGRKQRFAVSQPWQEQVLLQQPSPEVWPLAQASEQ